MFYPEELPRRSELEYASRQVNSIEINGTFYSLQKPESFRAWHDATPDDFIFSVKGGRYLTHITRLKEPKTPLANFFASGILNLGKKLGPVLWQLPPFFPYNRERLETFFQLLPRDTDQASRLARHHNAKTKGRSALKATADLPVRHALEVRHPSFENDEFLQLLHDHRIAIVVADTAGKWPRIEEITADFVYVRLHGDEEIYTSGYTETALDSWERKIRSWLSAGCDVFTYFDNDVKIRAPFDAISLGKRFGLSAAGVGA